MAAKPKREYTPDFLDRMKRTKHADLTAADFIMLLNVAEQFYKLDKEAARYVEIPVTMRTRFTGEPPYVGWKGIGLAIEEELAELDQLRQEVAKLKKGTAP